MAANAGQLHKLIIRLLRKTQTKELTWERNSTQNGYRTRIGDFAVTVEKSATAFNPNSDEPQMTVTRLDGGIVAMTSTSNPFGGILSSAAGVQPGTSKLLRDLWDLIANRDDDIEELLNLLGG